MNRLVVLLAVLSVTIAVLEARRDGHERGERARSSLFVPVTGGEGLAPSAVARMEIRLGVAEKSFNYTRRDGVWRIREYRDAYALGRSVDGLLEGIVKCRGVPLGRSDELRAPSRYGLLARDALKVKLFGEQDDLLAEVWVGRPVPGRRARESYMRLAGDDLVLRMNANPRRAFDWEPGRNAPPMVDVRVVPLAFARPSLKRASFEKAGAEVSWIEKRVPEGWTPSTGRPPEEWHARLADGREYRVDDRSAHELVHFLSRLQYSGLMGPRSELERAFEAPPRFVRLEYDDDTSDLLELGIQPRPDRVFLCNRTTLQVVVVSKQVGELLFPDLERLPEWTEEEPKG